MRKNVLAAGIVAGIFFGCFSAAKFAVRADEKPAADTPKKISPWKTEDFVYGETAAFVRISRDAKWLVWSKSTVDKEKDGRVSNLILSSLMDSTEIELTRGGDHNAAPAWSPNGERIAFLSDRKRPNAKPDMAGMQIWLINP